MPRFNSPDSPRYLGWLGLLVCSAMCMGAFLSLIDSNIDTDVDKWVTSVLSISLAFSFFGVLFHYCCSPKFVGKAPERILAVIVLAFWAVGMPYIQDPSRDYAATYGLTRNVAGINDAHLYFFSWGALACALWINNFVAHDTSSKAFKWLALCAASVVLLATTVNYHEDANCGSSETCKRNKFGIAVGAFATAASLLVICMNTMDKQLATLLEAALAVICAILYVIAIAVITFGDGAGTNIGNMYFSTLIGFVIAWFLASICIREVMGGGESAQEEQDDQEEAMPDDEKVADKEVEVDEERPEQPVEADDDDMVDVDVSRASGQEMSA